MEKISFNLPQHYEINQKKNAKEQTINSYVDFDNTPLIMPVYTEVPYGINKRNYIKLGVDKLPNGDEVHIYKLTTGQKVQILKTDGNSSIITKVNVGAGDEAGYSKGIAHFIEHSVFHGSEKYDMDLMKEIKKMATFCNASTSHAETKYYIDLANDDMEDLTKALDIQAEMLLKPSFSKIDKEKKIVCAESQDGKKDDTRIESQHALANLFNLQDINQGSICGNDESINSIELNQMKKFHQNFYQPHNMTTIIATKNNPDEVIKTVCETFGTKAPKTQTPVLKQQNNAISKTKRTDLISNNGINDTVAVSFVAGKLNSFEKLKLQALNEYAAKKYVMFIVDSQFGENTIIEIPSLALDDKTKPNELLQELVVDIDSLKDSLISDKELEEIKKYLKDDFKKQFEGGNQKVIENIIDNLNKDAEYIPYQTYEKMIDSLTAEDILDATKYLNLNKASILVSHNKNKTQEEIVKECQEFPFINMPIAIPSNRVVNNYKYDLNQDQLTGEKFYSTQLKNGSKIFFIDTLNDECEFSWQLSYSKGHALNPATIYVLRNLSADNLSNSTEFGLENTTTDGLCEIKDAFRVIDSMKQFSNRKFTKEKLKEAKEQALKDLEGESQYSLDIYKNNLYGISSIQDKEYLKEQIEKLTLSDITNEINNIILNSNSSIVVKAPVSKNPELMNKFASAFETPGLTFNNNETNLIKINDNLSDFIIRKNDNSQNQISQAYSVKLTNNPKDTYVFELMSAILSSKNFDNIREKEGLAYDSRAYFIENNGHGILMLNTDSSCTNDGDVEKIYNEYQKNIQEMLNGKITQEDLLLAKNKLIGTYSSFFDNKDESLFTLIHDNAFYPCTIETYAKSRDIINSITLDDIINASNYIFQSKPTKIMVAQQDVIDKSNDYINQHKKIDKK